MKNNIKASIVLATVLLGFAFSTYSEETGVEKIQTIKNKSVDKIKKNYRKSQDEVCNMVHGKTHCVPKKINHELKNTSDKIKTESQEVINQID